MENQQNKASQTETGAANAAENAAANGAANAAENTVENAAEKKESKKEFVLTSSALALVIIAIVFLLSLASFIIDREYLSFATLIAGRIDDTHSQLLGNRALWGLIGMPGSAAVAAFILIKKGKRKNDTEKQ